MSGTITVQNIQGPTTGADANKVIVPSGHNIYEQNNVVQMGSASTGYGAGARVLTNSTSWTTVAIGGTSQELINTTKNGCHYGASKFEHELLNNHFLRIILPTLD